MSLKQLIKWCGRKPNWSICFLVFRTKIRKDWFFYWKFTEKSIHSHRGWGLSLWKQTAVFQITVGGSWYDKLLPIASPPYLLTGCPRVSNNILHTIPPRPRFVINKKAVYDIIIDFSWFDNIFLLFLFGRQHGNICFSHKIPLSAQYRLKMTVRIQNNEQ